MEHEETICPECIYANYETFDDFEELFCKYCDKKD